MRIVLYYLVFLFFLILAFGLSIINSIEALSILTTAMLMIGVKISCEKS